MYASVSLFCGINTYNTTVILQQTVGEVVSTSECHLSTLTEQFIVDDCHPDPDLVKGEQDAVTAGTRCSIRLGQLI